MPKKIIAPLVSFLAATFAAGGVFLMGVLTAYAQPAPYPNGEQRMAEMSAALKLSAQQSTNVQAILDADRAAMEELHRKRDAIADATRQKLAKVLSAEQLGRFEEWRQSHRPPRPDGDAGRQQQGGGQQPKRRQ